MEKTLPKEMIDSIAVGFDTKMTFFGHDVSTLALILVISTSTIILLGIFILINSLRKQKR